ncbi:MAG: hypothetical protein QS748_09070 [Candidatus Endonucleobacter bathymodioli]|uniref:Uncharacterized protein n=1 Tax=Candidatus Endonucleibacter bathymodioli TaxID=539814 RepID=A0AA90ST97_9GAMM|nr:hypothetical protein [Candidatus Endonucleobacter bathymodioli]
MYIAFSFVTFLYFNIYIFDNVKTNVLNSLPLSLSLSLSLSLAICFFLSFCLILYQAIKSNKICIRRSAVVLILFLIYTSNRIIIDIEDISRLKHYLLANYGGMITFYVLGSFLTLVLNYFIHIVSNDKNELKKIVYIYLLYILSHSYFLIDAYGHSIQGVTSNVFVRINGWNYQRSASFLMINFIFSSVLFIYIRLLSQDRFKKTILLSSMILYMNMLIAMVLSLLIGSNNGAVTITGILFLTMLIQISLSFKEHSYILFKYNLKPQSLFFGLASRKLYASMFILLVSFILCASLVMFFITIDLSTFRLFGSVTGHISSVTSRIELLSNFLVQFNVSPIFGNIIVDRLTTGDGTYVHSTIASLLTHLGLIGFFIFMLYIILSFKELYRGKQYLFVTNGLRIYSTLLFMGVFLIAFTSVFFTWHPLWFLFGCIFPALYIENGTRK